jgi:hypothetical protein
MDENMSKKIKVGDLNVDSTEVVPPTKILRAPILGQYVTYVDRSKLTTTPLKFATPTVNSRTYNKPVHKYLNVKGVANKGVANSNLNATVPIVPVFDTQKVFEHTTSNIEDREGFVDRNDLGSAEYNVLTSGYGAKTEASGVTIDRLEKRKRKALKDSEVAYPEFNVILNSEYNILTSRSILESDCWLSYTWEKDNTLLYINHIDCPKKGEKKGRGKRHTLNTIRALWESGKRFNKIKVRPVPGLDPDRPIDPYRPDASLESLVATYKRWGFDDLITDEDGDAIQEGTTKHIEDTIAASLGGSRRQTKKTKKRMQRKTKTKRKQGGNKRRQTKKRGKR